jgi:hypothetical protein
VKLNVLPGDAGLNVLAFGAVGDGTTDDLAVFNAAVAAAAGGVLTIPATTYYLSDTWKITKNNTTIIAYGATFETDATAECVQLGDDGQRIQYTKFYGGEFLRTGAADYSAGAGFRLLNANWCVAELEKISGFRFGLSLRGTAGQGTSYCEAKCHSSVDCLFPLEIYAEGVGGFCNENIIFGGRYGYSSYGPDATGGYNVLIDTDGVASAPNQNRLYGCALESAKASDSPTASVYNNGVRNLFDDLRFEGAWTSSFLVIEGPNVTLSVGRNIYRNGRGLSGKSKVDLDGGRVLIVGEEGIYHKGGDGANAIYESQEANSNGNVVWRHRDVAGNVVFEMNAVGHLTLGENQTATLKEVYFVEQALVFGTVAAGGVSDVLVSIPGVGNSKFVVIATPQSHPGTGLAWGAITAGANQVRIRLINGTAAPIASIDRTWNIEVRKYA